MCVSVCALRFFQLGTYVSISALGLDRDMGFSRGHQGRQGHRPHDDDEDAEVEDNDKDDDNNGNGISSLGLDRDLVFSRVPSCGTPMT